MTKTLTANMQTKVTTNKGTEPLNIVRIDWSSGTVYYSEKDLMFGTIECVPAIIQVGNVSTQAVNSGSSKISVLSITLDDTDGSLKTIWNTEIIDGIDCYVYQYYEDLTDSDALLLFRGKIASDITWDEGERKLDFEIESIIGADEVGFALVGDEFSYMKESAIGQTWPMCFGTPLKVKAVQVYDVITGRLEENLTSASYLFDVTDGESFPQSVAITISVGPVTMEGSFTGKTFTATNNNKLVTETIDLADRPLTDPNALDLETMWLDDYSYLLGKYIYIADGSRRYINRVVKQEGLKCFLDEPTPVFLNSSDSIIQTCGTPHASWGAFYNTKGSGYEVVSSSDIDVRAGEIVRLVSIIQPTYVCNAVPTTTIHEVWGTRSYNGRTIFDKIPSRYCTAQNVTLAGQNCTVVQFDANKRLEDYLGENWSGDVYVSLTSSKGSNVADIIQYIIETYTDLTIDATTFADVNTKVENYPAHFAVTKQWDALSLCERIAWQARCALNIENGIVYIKYLSEVPVLAKAVAEDLIELKTMRLGFTPTNDVATRLIAKWADDYTGQDSSQQQFIYKNNIDTFGLSTTEVDFFIYNIRSLAEKSANFWGYRLSNSWRTAAFTTYLDVIDLEVFDNVGLRATTVSHNELQGIVKSLDYNPQENVIVISNELASRAGDVDDDNQPVEDTNYWTGDPADPVSPSDTKPTNPSHYTNLTNHTVAIIPSVKKIHEKFRRIRNSTSSTISKFTVVEIVSVDSNGIVDVALPTVDNQKPGLVLFVGQYDVPAGELGIATGPYKEVINTTYTGSPSTGTTLGTESGSGNLKAGNTGYTAQTVNANNHVEVLPDASVAATSEVEVIGLCRIQSGTNPYTVKLCNLSGTVHGDNITDVAARDADGSASVHNTSVKINDMLILYRYNSTDYFVLIDVPRYR